MKKVFALLLATMMVIGMSTAAFAARITGTTGTNTGKKIDNVVKDSVDGDVDNDWEAGGELKYTILADAFVDEDGAAIGNVGDTFSKKFLVTTCRVGVKASIKSGAKVVDSVAIDEDGGDAIILVTLVDPYVSTGDIDFELKVNYTIKGSRKTDYEVIFNGNLANEEVTVDDGDDFVTAEGRVVEATSNIKKIEVDLGNSVSIWAKMTNGKKYYGICDLDTTDADDETISKYPAIDTVINLKTINLNGANNTVDLSAYADYYVYDKDLNYLGKSSDALPYSTKYYLATSKLDIEDDVDEGEGVPEDEGSEAGGETGGDGDTFENANDNPGTGR